MFKSFLFYRPLAMQNGTNIIFYSDMALFSR